MYKKDLDLLLKNKKLSNFFLIFGSEAYQNEYYSKKILKIYQKENSELRKFYFDEYDFKEAKNFLSESSFFSDFKVLYIKQEKIINAKEIKTLIEICKSDQNTYFLLEIFSQDSKINEISKNFEGNFVRFFKPNSVDEAINLLNIKANELEIDISKDALCEIYLLHNENLNLAASELIKLKNLNKKINISDIQNLIFGLSEFDFSDFFDKLLSNKDIKMDIIKLINNLNSNEMMIINNFYSNFFKLFKINSYIKINGKFDSKIVLGYSPPIKIIEKMQRQALIFNLDKFKEIFITLNKADLEIKNKINLEKKSYLTSLILKIKQIIERKF